MKLDISRDTFRPHRHYSSVRLEQGRVQVDADWNEQIAINHHHTRTTARDEIGHAGAPKLEPGFEIVLAPDGSDLLITPGKFYVDGILCELDTLTAAIASYGPAAKQAKVAAWAARALAKNVWVEASAAGKSPIYTKITDLDRTSGTLTFADEVSGLGPDAKLRVLATYGSQPDLQVTLPSPLLSIGSAVIYLDVWERAITALEDPHIREVALGGADTATRTHVVWQVKTVALTGAGPFACDSKLPDYVAATAAPTGRLGARAKQDTTTTNPCNVPTSSGFRGLENQLYRVEIHDPGSLADGKATFKWSRDNGSVVGQIATRVGDVLVLAAPPRDEALGFTAGDWIEVSDDTSDLAGTPGTLIRLAKVEGKQLTLDPGSGSLDLSKYPSNPKARRWDSASAVKVASDATVDDGYLRLEDGVQVKFESGTYRTGDFWLIPARTITGDVEWPRDASGPIPQLRKGPVHHYARLAIATTAQQGTKTVTTIADCRRMFPPLTDITADDVSFDTDCDLLANAKTVHEALDILCHERDLEFHNQHLHGWGIVCGLQVHCGPDTGNIHDVVTVTNGYAIDSRGRDIIVDAKPTEIGEPGDRLAILDMLRAAKLLADPNDPKKLVDGSVSLILQQGAAAADRYRLELYDPGSNAWNSIFKDGFLWDVYMDCIVPLINAFKEEFSGAGSWEHVATVLNVLAQLVFPQNGPHVYISPKENQILLDFYEKLRGLLQSKTFCAMFDGRKFPDYNIFSPANLDPKPSTIFGKVLQGFSVPSRMRVTPSGAYAVAVSGKIVSADQSSIVDIFDLAGEKLAGTTAFPTAGATVTDVAFSADSKTMYAIAVLEASQDSLFASASLADPANPKWGQVTTLCHQPLVAMERSLTDNTKFYAVARGAGLFLIDAGGITPGGNQIASFNAAGHLELAMIGVGTARKPYAFCTVGAAPSYTTVHRVDLSAPTNVHDFALAGVSGSDGICVATDPNGKFFKLFVVTDPPAGKMSKQLVRFNAADMATSAQEAMIDLGYTAPPNKPGVADGTLYRVAYNDQAQKVMIASFEAFLIKTVPPTANALDQTTQPAQLWPIAITYAPGAAFTAANGTKQTGGVFVLNALSGTITTIPAAYIGKQDVNLSALATYHDGVFEAFIDLFGRFSQYLKDCFCEHFLVKCPSNEDKTLYLARLDIKNQQVFNICNFSRRRYVHSFPTVEYWMSIVPVLPVVRKLIGDACCRIVQEYFSTVNAPPAAKGDVVSSSAAWNGLQLVQATKPLTLVSSAAVGKWNVASAFGKALFSSSTTQPPAPSSSTSGKANVKYVANQPYVTASKYLADRNVTVVSKEVASSPSQLADALASPATLEPNDQVVLVTDQNDVALGYKIVKPMDAASQSAIKAQLDQQTTAFQAELGKRDAEITALKTQLAQQQKAHDDALAALGKRLDQLSTNRPTPPR